MLFTSLCLILWNPNLFLPINCKVFLDVMWILRPQGWIAFYQLLSCVLFINYGSKCVNVANVGVDRRHPNREQVWFYHVVPMSSVQRSLWLDCAWIVLPICREWRTPRWTKLAVALILAYAKCRDFFFLLPFSEITPEVRRLSISWTSLLC